MLPLLRCTPCTLFLQSEFLDVPDGQQKAAASKNALCPMRTMAFWKSNHLRKFYSNLIAINDANKAINPILNGFFGCIHRIEISTGGCLYLVKGLSHCQTHQSHRVRTLRT